MNELGFGAILCVAPFFGVYALYRIFRKPIEPGEMPLSLQLVFLAFGLFVLSAILGNCAG